MPKGIMRRKGGAIKIAGKISAVWGKGAHQGIHPLVSMKKRPFG
ncbi:MAG: hypothetical protein VB099_20195 [Candidatus Limiplasma sp.]|nr:hypothetical protein [Candidatus Limiplasma sp.]